MSVFRSGFESGVVLQAPRAEDGDWVQYLTGADQGCNWATDLPKRSFPKNRITYLVESWVKLAPYAEAKLVTVPDRDGRFTRALYMSLKRQAPRTSTGTRVQYGIYPPASMVEGYACYWLQLQHNLATEILPQGLRRSRQVMELKETGTPSSDFRWAILIQRDPLREDLYWRTHAQYGDLQSSPDAWVCTSTAAPVPVGEWFKFEVYWRSGIADGRVWGAVNGVTFCDHIGRTRADSAIYVWWPMKVYVGSNLDSFGGRPIYQWVDDVEIDEAAPAHLPAAPTGEGYEVKAGA